MDSIQFCAQESGPDEDHHTITGSKFSKVLEADCETYHWQSEILFVQRNSNIIDTFLNDVTKLVTLDGTYGLIWDENLQPSDGKYEPGLHYCGTRESDRKSVHGTVSFFRDGMTGVKFAIKTLEMDTYFHPEEIKVTLMNRHINICCVYGIIIRNHHIQILLEHAGLPLTEERAWIAESPQRLLTLARQSFQALEVLHQSGYVHCDLKPDNIMIFKNGKDFTVKLIDFGSCQRQGTALPHHAHTTMWYWSPEIWQALNHKKQVVCSCAMDVYALSLTLYFVQTSYHLMQLLKEDDIKDLMTQKPEHILLIALPESIPLELRAVMRQSLDGCPGTRLSAEKAVRQLTEDNAFPSENYKEKFERLYALLKNKTSISAKTVFGENSFQFSPEQSSGLQYFVGGCKSMEKPEATTSQRSKKYVFHSSTKINKNLSRNKKVARQQPLKVKTFKKNSEKCSSLVKAGHPQNEIQESIQVLEMNTDEKAYSCSILLKNLALQVRPSENKVTDVSDSVLGQADSFGDMKVLSLKSSTPDGRFPQIKKTAHTANKMVEGVMEATQNYNRVETIQSNCQQPLKVPTDQGTVIHIQKVVATVGSPTRILLNGFDANADSQSSAVTHSNVSHGIPMATDLMLHRSGDNTQQNPFGNVTSKTNSDDDVAFVIEAFGPGAFTGSEDDIVNNWVKMIEQDEQSDPIGYESVMDVNLNRSRGEHVNRELELMDTDQAESALSNQTVSMSDGIIMKAGRKRMSHSVEDAEIPKKSICPDHEQKLPHFDQILS
ncbi:serine/threonine-protein kinase pkn6 [Biomphalaria glabrata]|nr:serine/threonine-protein kinase pkn6 [Biomphalaria glabrata]